MSDKRSILDQFAFKTSPVIKKLPVFNFNNLDADTKPSEQIIAEITKQQTLKVAKQRSNTT